MCARASFAGAPALDDKCQGCAISHRMFCQHKTSSNVCKHSLGLQRRRYLRLVFLCVNNINVCRDDCWRQRLGVPRCYRRQRSPCSGRAHLLLVGYCVTGTCSSQCRHQMSWAPRHGRLPEVLLQGRQVSGLRHPAKTTFQHKAVSNL